MQTILGSGGAIGSTLAKELKKFDQHLRLVSRNPVKVNEDDELFTADLNNPLEVDQAVKGSSVVYLCVGLKYDLKVWQQQWPVIMTNTIQACLTHQIPLVFIDNVYMYPADSLQHMTEESTMNPPSKKGKIRQQLIEMLIEANREHGLHFCVARSADFYGPGIKNSLLSELVINKLKKGETALWQRSKHKIHSFTYTPDAAKAVALLGNTPSAYNQIWHLPTSKQKLTGEAWTQLIAKHLQKKPKLFVLPGWLLKMAGTFVPLMKELAEMSYQYKYDYIFDSSKFEEAFNFAPTPIEIAIQEVLRNEIEKAEK